MLRVIITDDHPVVLKGLKEIISEGFDDATVDVSSRGYELLTSVTEKMTGSCTKTLQNNSWFCDRQESVSDV